MTSSTHISASVQEVWHLRDRLKNEHGIASALDHLVHLETSAMYDREAIELNIAICNFELRNYEATVKILLPYIESGRYERVFGDFAADSIEILLYAIKASNLPAELVRLLHVLVVSPLLPSSRRLLSFVARLDLRRDTLLSIWEYVLSCRILVELDPPAMRRLWERCSAFSLMDLASEVEMRLANNDADQAFDKLVRQLIYEPTQPEQWQQLMGALHQHRQVDPYDAYRMGLALVGSDLGSFGADIMMKLMDASPGCWGLQRLVGVAHERLGYRKKAIDLYRSAAAGELLSRGIDIARYPQRHIDDVHISCIAISYNDKPLVEHYCKMVMAHCDELIVNDGGSTDGTIEAFERFSIDHNFPILVMKDQQHKNRDRTLSNKDGYRESGWGGVVGFDADRRRTLTLIEASFEYILMLDLDDYLPPFINLKSLIAASYGIEHFCGARLEVIGGGHYCLLQWGAEQGAPTLFKRNRHHIYAGVDSPDEYLACADKDLRDWAMKGCKNYLSECFGYWHLKYCLDGRSLADVRPQMGPSYSLSSRIDGPVYEDISHICKPL